MIQKRRNKKNKNKLFALGEAVRAVALSALSFIAAFSSFFMPQVQREAVAEQISPQYLVTPSSVAPPGDSLFLPGSYEEYLALENPSSVAVSERYTAIADGLKIYVYDRAENEYRYYTHEVVGDTQITQLKFDDANTLYFTSQGSTHLYAMNVINFTATDTNIACSAFEIHGDKLYYTTISENASISVRLLSELNTPLEPLRNGVLGKPAIAHNGETLYYTIGNILACVDDQSTLQRLGDSSVQSLTFSGDICYYTDTTNTLYAFRYAEAGAQPEIIAKNCVSVSSAYNGFIYVVGEKKVRQLNAETREFTSYEISASSASQGRLYAATDTALCGDKLITLDKGGAEENVPARIHVTPTATAQSGQPSRSFALSDLSGTANLIASDGATACVLSVLSASGGETGTLSVYDLSDGNHIFSYTSPVGEPFIGVACVYGTYYAVSKTRFYTVAPAAQALGETESSAEAYAVTSRSSRRANAFLASDAYGKLYVAQSDNKIYAYTESEFTNESGGDAETAAATLPISADPSVKNKKLLVDFHRNVYVLQGGAIVRCASESEGTPVSYTMNDKSFVYAQTQDTPVVSAAFGVETAATYVIYNGNFIAASYDLPLPTVNTVRVNGVDETLFSQTSAQFSVTECPEKTLLLRVDLTALNGAEYFPCISYGRTEKNLSAISIAETERYALLAVYDKEANDYYAALAEKDSCANVSEEEFFAPPPDKFQNGARGYVTNTISLYKYPYLTSLLTVRPLGKNAEVTVLKTVLNLDPAYYLVEYINEDGVTQTGFLPAAYVSETNGAAPQAQTATLGDENNNRDLVWRLVYIILGTLLVCILTDYLILRKHDKE